MSGGILLKEVVEEFEHQLERMAVEIDKYRINMVLHNPKGFRKQPIFILLFGKLIRIPFVYKKVHYDFTKQAEQLRKNGINSYEEFEEFIEKGGKLE